MTSPDLTPPDDDEFAQQSFVDRLKARAGDALEWDAEYAEKIRHLEQSVGSDSFDKLAWEMLYESIPVLKRSVKGMTNEFDYVKPAYEDLFNLFFQGDPQFVDQDEMLEGYADNHPLLKHLRGTDEVEKLREDTIFDEYNTAFSMLQCEDKMREGFERIKQAREAREQAKDDIIGCFPMGPGGKPDPNAQLTPEQVEALQAALAQFENTEAQMQEAQQAAAEGLAEAAGEASEQIDRDKETASAFGLGDGQLKMMSFEERRDLMAKLNIGKIEKIANLCGKWKMYGDAERRRTTKASGIRADVALGNDMTRLIAGELTNLAIPELEDQFWVRYAQHALLEWEEKGPEKLGKGPIIVICDESGSMGATVGKGNTREQWSKALALTLADQAKRGKRDFIYIGFSSVNQCWEMHFPAGEQPIDQVVTFVSHFFGGGTYYIKPLERAREIVLDYDAKKKPQPDIVFITDDDCHVAQEYIDKWAATREKVGMTCYGIQIGTTSRNSLAKLTDKTINLSALNSNPEGMVELFRNM